MTYPEINGTLVGDNLAELIVYANTVTNEWFGLFSVIAFFLVVLIGSIFMQLRISGSIRPETSLLASSFGTLGFATILEQYSGILNPVYFFWIIAILILSFIWVVLSRE